jgi:Arc/MetJ family transcription regulator
MGKTTVFLNDELINEVLKTLNIKTKREAIEEGLRELLRRKNRELLRKELGTYDIKLTPGSLTRLRSTK